MLQPTYFEENRQKIASKPTAYILQEGSIGSYALEANFESRTARQGGVGGAVTAAAGVAEEEGLPIDGVSRQEAADGGAADRGTPREGVRGQPQAAANVPR